ncbi:MAG: phosphate ABC transporter substrate-binding protein PstS [Actinobacteria bacterium]|nr:phosphate ABC transporter substrate-binding protein PstS [Actinomycetota bacterium]
MEKETKLVRKTLSKVAIIAAVFSLIAAPAHAVNLVGGGATFANPILDACKAEYARFSGDSYVYNSLGSGAGRSGIDKGDYDFGWSDTPHTGSTAPAGMIHLPVVAAPVAILYNIPGIKGQLHLSPTTLTKIFAREITKWNDPLIKADNARNVKTPVFETVRTKTTVGGQTTFTNIVKKDAKGNPVVKRYSQKRINTTLPNLDIIVIYRADSSGTSGILTNYLRAAVPSVWTKNGNNAFDASFPGNINAPANIGKIQSARGSELVSALAAKTPGAITYAEKDYATKNNLGFAKLYNNADVAVDPGAAGTSAFLGSATFNETNGTLNLDYATKNPVAYLLGSTSYALVLTNYPNKEKAAAVKKLMTFVLDECAKRFPATEFAVIDGALYDFNKRLIARIG